MRTTDGMLLAIVHPQGFTARLMLLDSQGRVLVQSDGLSPSDPDPVIDQHLAAGELFACGREHRRRRNLHLDDHADAGDRSVPAHPGGDLVPWRSWRATSPATAAPTWPSPTTTRQRRVGAAGQRRRHLPAPGHIRGGSASHRHRGGRLHRRRPPRPGRRQLLLGNDRVGAAGQRRRHVPAPGHLRGGSGSHRHRGG